MPMKTSERKSHLLQGGRTLTRQHTLASVVAGLALLCPACAVEDPHQPTPEPGPELFTFGVMQTWNAPIPTPAEVFVADFNADGRADLAFNSKNGPVNAVYFAFSAVSDTFVVSNASMHGTAAPEGWEVYETLIGLFNADARWDLGWSHTGTRNRTWYGLSDGVGGIDFAPLTERVEFGWFTFTTVVLDINGDRIDDLAWNETTTQRNRTFPATTDIFGFLDMGLPQSFAAADWSGFEVTTGDVNGDGRGDLLWNESTAGSNRTYTGLGRQDGQFDLSGEFARGPIATQPARLRLGDVNGDGTDDVVWVGPPEMGGDVYVSLAHADATFEHHQPQDVGMPCASACDLLVGDFNADGRIDLLWNDRVAGNRSRVALGAASARFDTSPAVQQHPRPIDWLSYQAFVGDVNADGRDDVVWVSSGPITQVHVAFAKP